MNSAVEAIMTITIINLQSFFYFYAVHPTVFEYSDFCSITQLTWVFGYCIMKRFKPNKNNKSVLL
jgi:hypothetical protein